MASYRAIRTDILTDESFGELPIFSRLMWIGLNLSADDQGRQLANPALIRAQLFPFDDISLADINTAIESFANTGWVILYTAQNKRYMQIVNWWSNHKTMQWAQPSKHPAPDGWMDRVRYVHNKQLFSENWDTPRDILPIKNDTSAQVDVPGGQSRWTVQVDAPGGQSTWTPQVDNPGEGLKPKPKPKPKPKSKDEPEPDLWQDAGGSAVLLAALEADCHIVNIRNIHQESLDAMASIGVHETVVQEVIDMGISDIEVIGHVLWAKDESTRENPGGLFTHRIRNRRANKLPSQYILKRCAKCMRLQCSCEKASYKTDIWLPVDENVEAAD